MKNWLEVPLCLGNKEQFSDFDELYKFKKEIILKLKKKIKLKLLN